MDDTSFLADVKSGDRKRALEALRDEIATQIDLGVAARDLASLSKRLTDILAELDELKEPEQKGGADEIARKRRERRARARKSDSADRESASG